MINLNTVVRSMYGSMIEFRAEVKNDINSMREYLNVMNDSVSNLSVCLQEHKEQTETELADLQTALDSAETNFTSQPVQLQTSLDSTQTNHNRLVNIKMDSLEECLSEHKEQVTGKLNVLQTAQANHSSQLEKIQEGVAYLKIINGPYTCGGTGRWRRVAYVDMTDPSTTCPSGWNMTGYSKRTCARATDGTNTCDSATFPVGGGEYSRICGRIRAYQYASPDAFKRFPSTFVATIDNAYIDGVSVTHGTPRNHIWTFVAGLSEVEPTYLSFICPCDASIDIRVPLFVGEDYFCESGLNEAWTRASGQHKIYSNDILWDGEDCLPSSTCCS